MIQLISALPFHEDSFDSLKKDWTRFKDGLVILSEIPDAICGEFLCEVEILEGNEDSQDTGDTEDSDNDNVTSNHKYNDLLSKLPSGNGKLILTSSKLYWISNDSPSGWSVDYKNVLLHAISKPSDSRPHIYLQLSCNKILMETGEEISFKSQIDDSEAEAEEKFVEVNLFVEDEKVVDEIFVNLSECASLYPCESDDEDEDDDFEDEDGPIKKINKIDRDEEDDERFEDAAEH